MRLGTALFRYAIPVPVRGFGGCTAGGDGSGDGRGDGSGERLLEDAYACGSRSGRGVVISDGEGVLIIDGEGVLIIDGEGSRAGDGVGVSMGGENEDVGVFRPVPLRSSGGGRAGDAERGKANVRPPVALRFAEPGARRSAGGRGGSDFSRFSWAAALRWTSSGCVYAGVYGWMCGEPCTEGPLGVGMLRVDAVDGEDELVWRLPVETDTRRPTGSGSSAIPPLKPPVLVLMLGRLPRLLLVLTRPPVLLVLRRPLRLLLARPPVLLVLTRPP